jgi:prevent-host-death family protein
MSESVNIRYAKKHLYALLERVREGAVITISSAGQAVAKLVPPAHSTERVPGGFAFKLTRKFFDPLPEDDLEMWEQ